MLYSIVEMMFFSTQVQYELPWAFLLRDARCYLRLYFSTWSERDPTPTQPIEGARRAAREAENNLKLRPEAGRPPEARRSSGLSTTTLPTASGSACKGPPNDGDVGPGRFRLCPSGDQDRPGLLARRRGDLIATPDLEQIFAARGPSTAAPHPSILSNP